MSVLRIVPNIAGDPATADAFYGKLFGLQVLMDMGWIRTYGGGSEPDVQISIATEGGSGTPVPALSIEVDNFEDILAAVRRAELPIEYGPVEEPWGVRRFFIRDPFGTLVNVLEHSR